MARSNCSRTPNRDEPYGIEAKADLSEPSWQRVAETASGSFTVDLNAAGEHRFYRLVELP